MMTRLASYLNYAFYLDEHRNAACRRMDVIGSALAVVVMAAANVGAVVGRAGAFHRASDRTPVSGRAMERG